MFEFYVEIEEYDDDFMIFAGDTGVPNGGTIKYIGSTPLEAYSKFASETTIGGYRNRGANGAGYYHADAMRELFYTDIKSFMCSRVHYSENAILQDIEVDANGCFSRCWYSNRVFEFGIRKINDISIAKVEDFAAGLAKLAQDRMDYINAAILEYDHQVYKPAIAVLSELGSDFCTAIIANSDVSFSKASGTYFVTSADFDAAAKLAWESRPLL